MIVQVHHRPNRKHHTSVVETATLRTREFFPITKQEKTTLHTKKSIRAKDSKNQVTWKTIAQINPRLGSKKNKSAG